MAKNVYLVITDLHWYYKNLRSHFDYVAENMYVLKKIEEIRDLTKDNATVRRWILVIMRYFEDRHRILTGHGDTQAELLKEYAARLEQFNRAEISEHYARKREEDDGK